MGPIGMSSGMDINSMVSKIVDSERVPKQQRIDYERNQVGASISAYGRLRESLDTMKDLMANFRQEKAFAARSVTTSEESVVSATATTDAIAGNYAVDVQQLAQSHKIASEAIPEDTKFGPGKLLLSLGDDSFDVSVGKYFKLTDIVRSINGARSNPGVRASIVKDMDGPRLIIAANQSGAEKSISINVEAESGNDELFRFEYKSLEQRVADLEAAQANVVALANDITPEEAAEKISSGTEQPDVTEQEQSSVADSLSNSDDQDHRVPENLQPESTEPPSAAKFGRPEDMIPGWTNTASGTLMDSYRPPEPELDEIALEKSKQVPGWTNTASGTLTDSYVTVSEAQAKLEQELAQEQQKIEQAAESDQITQEQAKQSERSKLQPEELERLEKLEQAQKELQQAQQSVAAYKGMTQVQAAQDSVVVLDGVAKLASHNNVIEDAIEGVDLTLKGTTKPGDRASEIGVEYDRGRVRADIEQFVAAYNQFFQVSQQLSKVDPVTGQAGPLAGDSIVRSADSRLKAVFSTSIEQAPPELRSLTEFGITTTRQGNLEINYQMLDKQLNNNFNKLEDFFGGNQGFAKKVEDAIHSLTGITGSIRTREKSLGEQNFRLNDDQDKLDRRMDALQKRTHDKFSAMQDATSKMQAQLTGLMNGLA